ncbi:MAG: hypothetical protein KIT87_13835 [Anaerolineae bacterium]|nr:hypothetical protein [Anaerolineae bacterium]
MQSLTRPLPTRTRLPSSLGLDAWVAVCITWLIGGLFLDGWAHINLPQLETFFTPWHGVLYSGFIVTALSIMGAVWRNRRQGLTWRAAVPIGYEMAVPGILVFSLGGMSDMTWHTLFGIERSIDALLSPPHLLLAVGGAMLGSGPAQAAWRRYSSPLPPSSSPRIRGEEQGMDNSPRTRVDGGVVMGEGWAELWPMLLGHTVLLALVTFFTMYAHPFGTIWAASMDGRLTTIGVTGALIQAALWVGLTLFILRRWPRLPFGSLTLLTAAPLILLVVIRAHLLLTGPQPLIVVALLGGLAADTLAWRLQPSPDRPGTLRLFAFLAPAVLYLFYYLALAWSGHLGWTLPFWTGSVVQVGLVGWLLSYLVIPPRIPDR